MTWRVAIGGVWHETNTFAVGETELEGFQSFQFALGEDILNRYAETGGELGGMIPRSRELGFEIVPTIFAGAVPSATISKAAVDSMVGELLDRLKAAGTIDGVLLVLHGAAVGSGIDDADAYVLARVREVVGQACPIVATFDYHANLSANMVAHADVLIGYDTFPHVDMSDRGREAADVLLAILESGRKPAKALRKIPLLTVPQMQPTGAPPINGMFDRLFEIEAEPGVVCGSIAMGFPYSDVPHLGASVVVYADDAARADAAAEELARAIWSHRETFLPVLEPVDAAVADALADPDGPIVLVDAADNVGGGSAGDGSVVLDALLRAGADDGAIVMADPEAVEAARMAGEGGAFDALVGGKADDMHGAPVRVQGRVRTYFPQATYRHTGSYMTGYESSMGQAAVVDAGGLQVVLTELRTLPFDAEQLRCVGIAPERQHILVVKSALAWRAAYGPMAKRAIVVDTPGTCASNVERYAYRRCPRPIYPLDADTEYDPGAG